MYYYDGRMDTDMLPYGIIIRLGIVLVLTLCTRGTYSIQPFVYNELLLTSYELIIIMKTSLQ